MIAAGTLNRMMAAVVLLLAALSLTSCSNHSGGMVSTANPHATRAAWSILQRGGSAMDAAIAAQLVLGLVEPQSSGIGGGLFALHWSPDDEEITAWDGRETAPARADGDLFTGNDGKPMKWFEASIGGRPVGVPGTIAALWKAHQEHGELDWDELFEPAIALANGGFPVSRRLHESIANAKRLADDENARKVYFLPGARPVPLPVGFRLKNPAYAATLKRIAAEGVDGFYKGPVAEAIVAAVTGHGSNPGLMSLDDLARYEAKRREAICGPYRQYRVCGMPPPTSGGLTTLMILGLLEPFNLAGFRPNSPVAVHLFTQAARLAYADRAAYMADSDFVPVPVSGLLDRAYLAKRSRLIDAGRDGGTALPGLRQARHRSCSGQRPPV